MGKAKDYSTKIDVRLGDEEVSIIPQRIGYLRRELPGVFNRLLEQNDGEGAQVEGVGDLLGLLGDSIYDVLCVFIPGLDEQIPRWMWEGYASESNATEDHYDRTGDRSPDPEQIEEALRVCLRLNKLDLLGALKNLIGPDLIRGLIQTQLAQSLSENLPS